MLNLSGLGLGYLALRRWPLAAVCMAATAGLAFAALPARPEGVPGALVAAWVAVAVLAAADGARRALRRPLPGWPRPALVLGLGLVLLAVPAGGTVAYGSARDEAVEEMLLERLAKTDALAQRAAGRAGFAAGKADYTKAVEGYAGLAEDHPERRAAKEVPAKLEALYESAAAPYREDDHCEAVEPLTYLRGLPDSVGEKALGKLATWPDRPLADSLYACGMGLVGEGQAGTGGDHLTELLAEFPESKEAGQVGPALLTEASERTGALSDAACDNTSRLRALDALTEKLPAESVTGVSDKARSGVEKGTYACGVEEFEEGEFAEAAKTFADFADTYKDNKNRDKARKAAIAAEIAEERPAAGRKLPPAGTPGGARMELVVSNGGPGTVEVLYTGPVTGRVTLKACAGCEAYSSAAAGKAGACKDKGTSYPKQRLSLPAGTYHFLYKRGSTSDAVRSHSSGARIEPGYTYTDCAYTVRGLGGLVPPPVDGAAWTPPPGGARDR
ncbi:tol-pal system YbgF family protein [Streptomyces sp. NPDC058372]|uniref:tetratricopeptide repeat protein n=1 Tax=Streptomyces sp. NPDC058372 TaxID=3346464 RepID=UPI003645FD9B